MKLSYSKPFHNNLNYASTANVEEVMKFYNLNDKTFETDFSFDRSEKFRTFMCMIKIFKGGGGEVVDGEGVAVKDA